MIDLCLFLYFHLQEKNEMIDLCLFLYFICKRNTSLHFAARYIACAFFMFQTCMERIPYDARFTLDERNHATADWIIHPTIHLHPMSLSNMILHVWQKTHSSAEYDQMQDIYYAGILCYRFIVHAVTCVD